MKCMSQKSTEKKYTGKRTGVSRFTAYVMALIFSFTMLPLTASGASQSNSGIVPDGGAYSYTLPQAVPQHNYYSEAFSTSHEFRDIFIAQYGSGKAVVYDMMAHVMITALYDDTVEYGRDINVYGFEQIANVLEMSSAQLAVQKDMPFLGTFLSFGGGGSEHNYKVSVRREVSNYFSEDAPNDNRTYIAARQRVIAELNQYRFAVDGVTDDVEKLEIAGKLFDADSVYDKSAPYHGIEALLTKRGVCGGSTMAFTMVGNAVGVPSYYLHIVDAKHASVLVRPNGGELMVIDVTFGKRNPKVMAVSSWKYRGQVSWEEKAFGFTESFYFPDVDLFGQLGGLS